MEVRRHIFQLAVGDALFDQLGQVLEGGGANGVQFLNHLRHLIALDHLFFQTVEQAVALRVAHPELEVARDSASSRATSSEYSSALDPLVIGRFSSSR